MLQVLLLIHDEIRMDLFARARLEKKTLRTREFAIFWEMRWSPLASLPGIPGGQRILHERRDQDLSVSEK